MIGLEYRSKQRPELSLVAVLSSRNHVKELPISKAQQAHLKGQLLEDDQDLAFSWCDGQLVAVYLDRKGALPKRLEKARMAGARVFGRLEETRTNQVQVLGLAPDPSLTLAFTEGLALSSHSFRKYKTNGKPNHLREAFVSGAQLKREQVEELFDLCQVVCAMRDLVNEPVSFLNATQLASEIRTIARNTGIKVRVFDKAQIDALGMGGLLAVNRGSPDPPSFTIMEYKPKKVKNQKPIVLVGKGVVYDTGGLSLKPTPNSMDYMKCDMAGAATMIGAISAAALRGLPLHIVALIPATDNRPGGNAFAPGDVVRMHSGSTVEVMNSDAEGRMILADGLSYAERYEAELVITAATLTGAAARAIGTQGIVAMGTAGEPVFTRLAQVGDVVHERIARFPFWEEYDRELDSDIADMKNLGGDSAGMITAGKFLARFTTRPYVHLDIAGTAYLQRAEGYRTKGGTGSGIRLLYQYFKERAKGRS
ncbi:MAG: peptidase M17 [Flavobacteriales bacterium]|nr:peptidase M17 [Flavobacteriales bacterium]